VKLKAFNLSFNGIEQHGGKYIADAILSNNTIEAINLENTRINDEAAVFIGRALRKNETLKSINVINLIKINININLYAIVYV
jgi:Ran GTPase-activating protein (RanGAP) involved in mRNA processing and transport